jgi:hypothetical protein
MDLPDHAAFEDDSSFTIIHAAFEHHSAPRALRVCLTLPSALSVD